MTYFSVHQHAAPPTMTRSGRALYTVVVCWPLSLTRGSSIMEDIRDFCSVSILLSWYISPSRTESDIDHTLILFSSIIHSLQILFLNDHAFYGYILVTNELKTKNLKNLYQLLNKVTKDLCKLQGMIHKKKGVRLHD